MKRAFLALLPTGGMIAGYASAFGGGGWDGKPCHRREPPPASVEP